MHQPATTHADMAELAAAALARLRQRAPRVHCITNNVAQNFTANVLLAVACVPSMTLSADEIAGFVAGADSLLVNLGTFDAERRAAVEAALDAAAGKAAPWVLDPVFIDRSAARAQFARSLLMRAPAVVRLNRAEFSALAGGKPPHEPAEFARANGTVVAISGETDLVTDGARSIGNDCQRPCADGARHRHGLRRLGFGRRLPGGRAGLHLLAAAAALVILGVAGEVAAGQAQGPGSFAVGIVDALYNLDGATLRARAKVS